MGAISAENHTLFYIVVLAGRSTHCPEIWTRYRSLQMRQELQICNRIYDKDCYPLRKQHISDFQNAVLEALTQVDDYKHQNEVDSHEHVLTTAQEWEEILPIKNHVFPNEIVFNCHDSKL